jgi:hypothetical protein
MYASSLNLGNVVSGEKCVDLYPKTIKPNRSGIIYYHGVGSGATWVLDQLGNQADLTMKLSRYWPGVAATYGGDLWGNDASIAEAELYLGHLHSRGQGAGVDFGTQSGSMGGATALNQAIQGTTYQPTAMCLILPTINIDDIHANNRGGLASSIDAAYGGAWSEGTYGALHNPHTYMASPDIAGIPMLIFYGLTDDICLPAYTEAFIAADPSNRTGVPLATGHDFDSYAAVDHDMIVEFFKSHQVVT